MNISALKAYYDGFPDIARRAAVHTINTERMAGYYLEIAEKIGMLKARLAICNPDLNIWQAAGLDRHERKHCSLLAWLLNPHGSHYQGAAFLALFIRHCINGKFEGGRVIDTSDLAGTMVQTEYTIDNGRGMC